VAVQDRFVLVASVGEVSLEVKPLTAGAWFLVTLIDEVAAEPTPLLHERLNVLTPGARLRLAPLVAAVPLTVQVGVG
jgi:hypothetical protein